MQNILQVAPFEQDLNSDGLIKLLSTQVQDFLLASTLHPKLLVPFAITEGKEEG